MLRYFNVKRLGLSIDFLGNGSTLYSVSRQRLIITVQGNEQAKRLVFQLITPYFRATVQHLGATPRVYSEAAAC